MDWHDCDGVIGQYLRYVSNPLDSFHDGKPTWVMVVESYRMEGNFLGHGLSFLPVQYCPVCGERLREPKLGLGSG